MLIPNYRLCAAAWGVRTIELLDSYASEDRIYETAYTAAHCAHVLFLEICSGCREEFDPATSDATHDRDNFCSFACEDNYDPTPYEIESGWSGPSLEDTMRQLREKR